MAKIDKDCAWLIIQAQDLLNELKTNHYLLECVDRAISDAYFDADSSLKPEIEKIGTVLRAYDPEKAVTLISQAIQLLEDARK